MAGNLLFLEGNFDIAKGRISFPDYANMILPEALIRERFLWVNRDLACQLPY